MKSVISLFLLVMVSSLVPAQSLNGVYSFQRQEMVAAFKFSPNFTFEFFYSYGASDRVAAGSYAIVGDTVKLKSNKEAGNDFEIVTQKSNRKQCQIAVKEKDQFMRSSVVAVVFVGNEQYRFEANNEGLIETNLKTCSKIFLQHLLFPDVLSLIKDESNKNNSFEVKLKPSLAEVSFKGIDLYLKDNELTCLPNYFMPIEGIRFVKKE